MNFLSDRVMALKPSATMSMAAKGRALKEAGKKVISLTLGEPDFPTPAFICQAASQAMADGLTKYTAAEGTPALRKAIVAKLARDNQLHYSVEQVMASDGAKHSLYNLFQAVLNPGDEVIVLAPYWVSYPEMAELCGAKPVVIAAGIEHSFKIRAEQLAQAITPRTKMVVFNSPNNPSGMVYTRAEWQALAAVLLQHPQVLITTDDIYEHIYWGNEPFANILNVCPALYERTVVINGASKAYSMTGWRLGFAAGPKAIIEAMAKMQSQNTSCPSSISQAAAVAAFNGDQTCVATMCSAFKERHDYVVAGINRIPGLRCLPAQGAFYAFVDARSVIQELGFADDVALAEFLLEDALVATVPGSAFGLLGYIRLSYATDLESLKCGLDQMTAALACRRNR